MTETPSVGRPLEQILCEHGRETPDHTAFTFLDAEGESSHTYASLNKRVASIAAILDAHSNLQDRALLLYPSGLAFIEAFLACLRSGVVAIPTSTPRPNKKRDRNLERVFTILEDAAPRMALTTRALFERFQTHFETHPELASLTWVVTDDLPDGTEHTAKRSVTLDHTAFLQYTSGSTSKPKGVVVTHGNLIANERMIQKAFDTHAQTVVAGWLPFFHDMGLIGNILHPLYLGVPCHLMAPETFLQQPYKWLKLIHDKRATCSGGPNFAFEFCAARITDEQKATLDLSCWDTAFNGSEPIRDETLTTFAEAFAQCGFQKSAFLPCYGLAETTLLVSGGPRGSYETTALDADALYRHEVVFATDTSTETKTLVCSGAVSDEQDVWIVDPNTHTRCKPDQIGEIWVRGENVAKGYWANPELSQATFEATAKTGEGPFLRTGDMGFLHDRSIYVTGRLKDMLIIRGRNHYPQDIEQTVQAGHPALRKDACAVFSVEIAGEESACAAIELERTALRGLDPGPVIEAVREAVMEDHGLNLHALLLLRPGGMPKTTSGKIQRRKCRDLYLAGELQEVQRDVRDQVDTAADQPTDQVACDRFDPRELPRLSIDERSSRVLSLLTQLASSALNIHRENIPVDKSLWSLGFDSLALMSLQHQFTETLGVAYDAEKLHEGPTLREMAHDLSHQLVHAESASKALETLDLHPQALSHNQQALWLIHRLDPESAAYHIPFAVRVTSVLDLDLLAQALHSLAARHPLLRTTYRVTENRPQALLGEPSDFAFEAVDAASWDDQTLAAEVGRAAYAPIDLEQGPVCRFKVFSRSPEDHVWLLVCHHIAVDMWSLFILFEELGATYDTLIDQEHPTLTPPQVSYAAFTAWQQHLLAGDQGARQWAYWQQQLAGDPPVLKLTTDRPRPPVQTYAGGRIDFTLSPELAQSVRDLARSQDTTLYATLLAAFQVMLYRYTGQVDFCVGTPVAGRNRPEFSRVVGDFVNTLVLRSQITDAPNFTQFLTRTKKVIAGALAHADYPVQMLVERLCPNRDLSYSPLFQTLFSFQQPPLLEDAGPFILGAEDATMQLGRHVKLATFPLETRASQVDLSLTVSEAGDTLSGCFVYNTDLFHTETAALWPDHFQTLLADITAAPETPLHALNLSSPQEQRQLADWNDSRRSLDRLDCLHRLIAHQARQTPERTALLMGGVDGAPQQSLTYQQLSEGAQRVAAHLNAIGAGPETIVAVAMDRSPAMVIAMLGILEAGAAYLPLDLTHPPQRLAYILEDSGTALILSQAAAADKLPQTNAPVHHVDNLLQTEPPTTQSVATVTPDNLAYVIYTSGSTGNPKGVQITHQTLVNFLLSTQEKPGLTAEDTLLAVTTVSFDIAGLELFLPLITGARLVLADEEEAMDPARLTALIAQHHVTIMQATPSTWRLMTTESWPHPLKVLCGGEALPVPLATTLTERAESLWNMYGPTETTIWSAARPIPAGRKEQGSVEPIGHPLWNTHLLVFDSHGRMVPTGVPGELHIGGAGLARGYHRKPSLTASRFLPDPYTKEPGSRIYATGDSVRYLPNGELEFLGRIDHQIKLRGYRIETGEIERNLAEHPGVAEAVVIVREDRPGDKRLTAYVTSSDPTTEPDAKALRAHLLQKLPEYMTPSHVITLAAIPLTPNGKTDRKALPAPQAAAPQAKVTAEPDSGWTKDLRQIWKDVLGTDQISIHDNFFELGGHSLLMAEVNAKLERVLGRKLPMVELFRNPTIESLARHLSGETQTSQAEQNRAQLRKSLANAKTDIAVIGLSGRFPGASSVDAFWQNLTEGKESITFYTEEELLEAGVDPSLLANANYVKAGTTLEDVTSFDAPLFDFNPREADLIDPQQRVFLEISWEALERAGYNPDDYQGSIGVYAGSGMNTYLFHNLYSPRLLEKEGSFQVMFSNDKDFLATRASYKLNLRGPSVNVQTACSTSLVAIHLAAQALRQGECDMALAGGSTIRFPHKTGYLYQDGLILSPTGHCRAFDHEAAGTISSNGAGVVLLKRLDEALADGDPVLAVLKGSALNNDASVKVGYTAPGVDGQKAVITEALAVADVSADTVTYVEAHGTGTKMGDPIEISALTQAYRTQTEDKGYCSIGSVKTNIGHLDTAAGVTGFIKTVMALKHKQIPPSLNFDKPNPEIDFENSPFFVNTQLRDWEPGPTPRRAAISSFGIGGTNAHAILEEAPEPAASGPSRPHQVLVLSAKTASALDAARDNLRRFISEHPDSSPADLAWTLQVGRKRLPHRLTMVYQDLAEAAALLDPEHPEPRILTRHDTARQRTVAFMFSGQGAQYARMAMDTYHHEAHFRETVARCCDLLEPHLGFDLREVLFPEDEAQLEACNERLRQTSVTQPALFVIEYALAKLWMSWGVTPAAMIGHSIGEYVAACLAGVFTLEDALELVAVRGRLIQALPTGAMTAVAADEADLKPLLDESLCIAALNPRPVVSGPVEAIEHLEQKLAAKDVVYRRLRTSHAFHSRMMEPILGQFADIVAATTRNAPTLRYLSNVSGDWITADQATDPQYWVDHLRGTVRFGDGVNHLFQNPDMVLLEVGPGQTLGTLARQNPARQRQQLIFGSLKRADDQGSDHAGLLTTLGKLWLAGVAVDWHAFRGDEQRRRIVLPTYPFERRLHWKEPNKQTALLDDPGEKPTKNPDPAQWFYTPSWKRTPISHTPDEEAKSRPWLILADAQGKVNPLAEALKAAGYPVVLAKRDDAFTRINDFEYTIRAAERQDIQDLLDILRGREIFPVAILHAWLLDAQTESSARALGFQSLMLLAQALGNLRATDPLALTVFSAGMQEVIGGDAPHPEQATLLGPLQVIPREHPHIQSRGVDLSPGPIGAKLTRRLFAELTAPITDTEIAYRGPHRWTKDYEQITNGPAQQTPLTKEGVYLITGGLGGIGLTLARHLAKTYEAKLILTGRSPLPARDAWASWLASHDVEDPTSLKIRAVQDLEQQGATVHLIQAAMDDATAMGEGLAAARARFGRIHGVLHAAGVPGGGLIQQKDPETVHKVMAPKVEGSQMLRSLLQDDAPDFTMLFSSINTVLPRMGQVDYLAANAYMDALAAAESSDEDNVISVNWDSWRDAGMAAATVKSRGAIIGSSERRTVDHPFFDCRFREDDTELFLSRFRVEDHWPLNEHWIMGKAILPGTTYLEMARAAFDMVTGKDHLVMREVSFLLPFILEPGEVREVRTALDPKDDGYVFSIKSLEGETWREHARGRIEHLDEEPPHLSIPELVTAHGDARLDHPLSGDGLGDFRLKRFARQMSDQKDVALVAITDQAEPPTVSIDLGARWQTTEWIKLAGTKSLALIGLPEETDADQQQLKLHPALLDFAVGFQRLFRNQANYLPLSYHALKIFGPLSPKVYSAVSESPRSGDNPTFDILLLDEAGNACVAIESFSLGRLDPEKLRQTESPTQGSTAEADMTETWLSNEEGVEVFERALSAGLSRLVISTTDLVRRAKFDQADQQKLAEGGEENQPTHPRPDLMTPYAPPRNEHERKLADIWQNVMGIEKVGIHDDFNELGGDSLLITRIHARVGEVFDTEITVAELMQHPNIADLTAFMDKQGQSASQTPEPAQSDVRKRANKQKSSMQQQKKRMQQMRRKRKK